MHVLQESDDVRLAVTLDLPDASLRLGVLDEEQEDCTTVLPESVEEDFKRLQSLVASQLHLTRLQTSAIEFRCVMLHDVCVSVNEG